MAVDYQKRLSAITSDASTIDDEKASQEDSTTSYDEEQDSDVSPVCGCGRVLDSGWQCSNCRRQCLICNRVLSLDPNEYCERCYRQCQTHDILYTITTGCPLCKNK